MPILTPEERIGTTLGGKYRLGSLIGKGGMGMVFRGEHEFTKRAVAIKLLHPEHTQSEEVCARFFREARTAAGLKHPNVVDVLDMGREDGAVYIVLELLEGEPLSSLLHDEGALSVDRAAAILLPVMRAVAMAHARNVVHRDLKPENIFIHHDATGAEVPKILDFGIAKALGEEQDHRVTQTGFVLGTPAYMSPEQAEGIPEKIGPPADVWSMGVVWYEVLSGDLPFGGPTHTAILLSVVQGKFQRLTRRAPTVPVALAAAIDKALVKDPARRYPDMGAFLQAIEHALKTPEVSPALRSSLDDVSVALPPVPASVWTLDGSTPTPARHEAPSSLPSEGTASLQAPIPLLRRTHAPSRPPSDSLVAPVTLATPLPARTNNTRLALGVALGVAFAAGAGVVAMSVFRPARPPSTPSTPTAVPAPQAATHPPAEAPSAPPAPTPSTPSTEPLPRALPPLPVDVTSPGQLPAPSTNTTAEPTSSPSGPPAERSARRHSRRNDPSHEPTAEELRANPLLILAPRTPPSAPTPPPPAPPAPPPPPPPTTPATTPPPPPPPPPPRPSAPTHEPMRDYEASP